MLLPDCPKGIIYQKASQVRISATILDEMRLNKLIRDWFASKAFIGHHGCAVKIDLKAIYIEDSIALVT